MFGEKSRLRTNARGVGILGHPAILGIIGALVAIIVVAFLFPFAFLASLGTLLFVAGAAIAFGTIRANYYVALIGTLTAVVGFVLLWLLPVIPL